MLLKIALSAALLAFVSCTSPEEEEKAMIGYWFQCADVSENADCGRLGDKGLILSKNSVYLSMAGVVPWMNAWHPELSDERSYDAAGALEELHGHQVEKGSYFTRGDTVFVTREGGSAVSDSFVVHVRGGFLSLENGDKFRRRRLEVHVLDTAEWAYEVENGPSGP